MPLIAAIEKQKRRPRAEISLEGGASFELRLDVVVLAGLVVGMELDEGRRRELEAEDQRLGALEAALRLLAGGQKSERDLRDRLKRRGFRAIAVDGAVERMQGLGYLNDAVFARSFVESRTASTPRSRRALAFELSMKGVEREVAASAVEAVSDSDAAMAAAQRRLRSLRNLDRQSFARKLGTFLASRGFSYGVSRGVIDRCWLVASGQAEDDDEAIEVEDTE